MDFNIKKFYYLKWADILLMIGKQENIETELIKTLAKFIGNGRTVSPLEVNIKNKKNSSTLYLIFLKN